MSAPEKLWLSAPDVDNEHSVWFEPDEGGTEYVRVDLTGAEAETWNSITSAPKDGTMLRLLVRPVDAEKGRWTPFEDSPDAYVTIGFNALSNTGDDEWQFAGWNWSHDCFTDGGGEIIGWLPLRSVSSPPPEDETVVWQSRARRSMEGDVGEWSKWRDGKAPQPIPLYFEVEERALFTRPPAPAVTEAMVAAAVREGSRNNMTGSWQSYARVVAAALQAAHEVKP